MGKEQSNFSGESDPDEEQRRRDDADAEKLRRQRGILPEPEIRQFSTEEFLRLGQPEKPEDGTGNKSAE